MTNFGTRLKMLRNEMNLSQAELATALKLTRSAYAMYEQGRREPAFEILETIADFFNVDMDYLCGRSDVRNVEPFCNTDMIAKVMHLYNIYKPCIELYDSLSAKNKESAIDFMNYLLKKEE